MMSEIKTELNRKFNRFWINRFRIYRKKFNAEPSLVNFSKLQSVIAKTAAKDVFHKKKASRLISNFRSKVLTSF